MQEKSPFALTLIALRKQKRVSSQQVADAIGIKGTTYRRYEISTEPKLEVLVKIADYFGVSVDYLVSECRDNNSSNSVFVCENGEKYVVERNKMELNNAETKLINTLRSMSDEDMRDVLNFVDWKNAVRK